MPWTCSYRDVTKDFSNGPYGTPLFHCEIYREASRMIYSMLKKMDRWCGTKAIPLWPVGLGRARPGWGLQFLTLNNLRVNQNAIFLDIPVLKGFSDNFTERCIDFSLCWEHFRQRTWNCEYTSWRGGRREDAPMCLKPVIGAAFGCLTVNYGHM